LALIIRVAGLLASKIRDAFCLLDERSKTIFTTCLSMLGMSSITGSAHQGRWHPHSLPFGCQCHHFLPPTLLISKSGGVKLHWRIAVLCWTTHNGYTFVTGMDGDEITLMVPPLMLLCTPSSYGITTTQSGNTSHGNPGVASPPPQSSAGKGASGSIAGLPSKSRSASVCARCAVAL
jgi:hypothetical protein